MSQLDVSRSLPVTNAAEFDAWLEAHGRTKRETVIALYNASSSVPLKGDCRRAHS